MMKNNNLNTTDSRCNNAKNKTIVKWTLFKHVTNMVYRHCVQILHKKTQGIDEKQRTSSSHSSDSMLLLLYFHFLRVFLISFPIPILKTPKRKKLFTKQPLFRITFSSNVLGCFFYFINLILTHTADKDTSTFYYM